MGDSVHRGNRGAGHVAPRLCSVNYLVRTGQVNCRAILDTEAFPAELFADLYHRRWGIETQANPEPGKRQWPDAYEEVGYCVYFDTEHVYAIADLNQNRECHFELTGESGIEKEKRTDWDSYAEKLNKNG
jgi:hypothetical protein